MPVLCLRCCLQPGKFGKVCLVRYLLNTSFVYNEINIVLCGVAAAVHLGVVNFLEALQDQVPAEADVTLELSKQAGQKPDSMDEGH